jgi:single-strand DNA-binding protein
MAGLNKVILIGNIGKDPEVRTLENNVKNARFSLATTESYKDKNGQKVDQTEWHNIIVWRGLAEVAEKYLRKGMPLYVEGKIRRREYTDKDGVKKYMYEIQADNFLMIGRREEGAQTVSQAAEEPIEQVPETGAPTDDLPF